jgi:gamma-glutamyltranspeptidase
MEGLRLRFNQRLRATRMPDRSFYNRAEMEAAVQPAFLPNTPAAGLFERATPEHLFQDLARLGYDVSWSNNRIAFGRGQIIWRDAHGVLCGGTEPRTDGAVAAW